MNTTGASQPKIPQKGQLFLERFIERHFDAQPRSVRAFVYLLFAVLLAYSIYQAIGGEVAVQGRLFVKVCSADKPISADGTISSDDVSALEVECDAVKQKKSRPARELEIVVGDKHFGVNSRGEYYIVLNRLGYSGMMIRGELPLRIYNGDGSLHELHKVAFNRVEQSFEDLTMPSQSTLLAQSGSSPFSLGAAFPEAAAWAHLGQASSRKALLFLTAVKLAEKTNPRLKEGRWELYQDGISARLQVGGPDIDATTPLLTGQTIDLGRKYYFSVPLFGQGPGRLSGRIVLRAEAGFFSSYTETFAFSKDTGKEASFTVSGDRGSEVELLLSLPVDTNLAEKASSIEAKTCEEVADSEICHKKYPAGCANSPVPTYDAYFNFLKNLLPSASLESSILLTQDDFATLESRTPMALTGRNHAAYAETLASVGEGRIVTTVGYLYQVKGRGPETANCQLFGPENAGYNLYIGFDPSLARRLPSDKTNDSRELSRESIRAVITPHYRAQNHPKWTIARLSQAKGMQIKVVGQLLMDNSQNTPSSNCGRRDADRERCFRASAWELHPVTQLYVCKSSMACTPNGQNWEPID
jgi:hypothetical protein